MCKLGPEGITVKPFAQHQGKHPSSCNLTWNVLEDARMRATPAMYERCILIVSTCSIKLGEQVLAWPLLGTS